MDLHLRPHRRLSRTPLNGAVPRSLGGQEGHLVGMWLPTGGCGFPTPSLICFLTMMRLYVARQQPERHLLPELCTLNPTLLPLLVGSPRCRNPSHVSRLRMRSRRLARVSDHSDCLPDVSLQAHPVEQPYQGAEIPLDPYRVI